MVFLSYAHKDGAKTAQDLFNSLQKANLNPWLDQDRLRGGASWSLEIEQALDDCDAVAAILTEGSYRSDICRAEQLRALRKGKRVIPVFIDGDKPLYLEHLQHVQPKELIEALGETPETKPLPERFQQTRYDTVPSLPPEFTPRPETLAALRDAVLAEQSDRTVALTAIRGMGGVGKTVLATALAKDPVVLDAYPDGVIWITIGEKPGDPVAAIREAARTLGEPANEWENPNQLRNALRDRAALLILDDVWNADHALPYLPDNARCRVLVTTRSSEVAGNIGAREHSLDVLPIEEALAMLEQYAGKRLEHAEEVADRCGRLPLALAIIGRLLKRRPEDRVLTRLRTRDFDKLDDKILAAVDLSVRALPDGLRRRYLDLAVFEADAEFPLSALQALWNDDDELDAADSADSLVEASLLIRRDELFTLHDLPQAYIASNLKSDAPTMSRPRLRGGSANTTAAALHSQLLTGYAQRCPNGWPTGPNDGYFYQNLAHHLNAAGRQEELEDLLLSPAWMEAKLHHTNTNALTLDYQPVKGERRFQLIQGAIRLSNSAIDRDPREISSQLIGRLLHYRAELSSGLEDRLRTARKHESWLEPVFPALAAPGGPLLRTMQGHAGWVKAVAVTPNGDQAVSASFDRTLKLWNLDSGRDMLTLRGHSRDVLAVAVTPDGGRAISASGDETLKVWDLESGQELRTLEGHSGGVCALAITPDGQRVVSAAGDKTLKVWDLNSGDELRTLRGHHGAVLGVAVTSDGRQAVSASCDQTLKVWDLGSGNALRTLRGHTDWVLAAAVTPDGRWAVSASSDQTLKVWDIGNGAELRSLLGHHGSIHGVAITPDGRRLISASDDETLRLWDLDSGDELRTLQGHHGSVLGVAVTSDGRRAVSTSSDQTLRLWDLESGEDRWSPGNHGWVFMSAVTPDRSRAVSLGSSAKVWNLDSGEELFTLAQGSGLLVEVAIARDGKRLVSGSSEGIVKVWDLENGQELQTLQGRRHPVPAPISALAITQDGGRVISASSGTTMKVWDLDDGQELRRLVGHTSMVSAVAVTPGGDRVISASRDTTLKVWDLGSGQELRTLKGHTREVSAVAVASDGRRAVSASLDATVKTWDIDSGRQLCSFTADCPVIRIMIDSDCQRIIAGDQGGNLHILRLHLP